MKYFVNIKKEYRTVIRMVPRKETKFLLSPSEIKLNVDKKFHVNGLRRVRANWK